MSIVLGIDPGLGHTGWGVIDVQGHHIRFVASGRISTNAKNAMAPRLVELYQGLEVVLKTYRPVTGGIEETFVNKNALSSLKLGHARGTLMLTAQLVGGLLLSEYAPNLVKKSVVGTGHADKQQVAIMVKRILPTAQIASEDAADALAVAICHSHHMQNLLSLQLKKVTL